MNFSEIKGDIDNLPALFTEKDLRQVVFGNKLSRHNVYVLMHSAGFPTVRVGRKLYVSKLGFIQWINKKTAREASL